MAHQILRTIRSCTWFWVLLILSVGLIVASFIVPPTGVIDASVLKAVGELFAFGVLGTVIYAVDRGVDAKLSKGDTALEINSPDNPGARR